MLSLLTGLVEPARGSRRLHGRTSSVLELGSGFHPELTGRENLKLNAALTGMSEAQATLSMQSIIDFSELHDAIDEPLRTYSAGMVLRLGFGVAIHGQFDVLLVDEILAVGDIAFQNKCLNHIEILKRQGKTLVIVTHSPASLDRFCERAIWLHHGHVAKDGPFAEVAAEYVQFISDPGRRLWDELPKGPVTVSEKRTRANDPERQRENRSRK